jgi:hypothetical protein
MRKQPMSHIYIDYTSIPVHHFAFLGGTAMDWEFGIVIVLLLWILWRVPVAWRTEMILRRIYRQLNLIESHARNVPLAVVEKEWDVWCENAMLRREGTLWRQRIPWGKE